MIASRALGGAAAVTDSQNENTHPGGGNDGAKQPDLCSSHRLRRFRCILARLDAIFIERF